MNGFCASFSAAFMLYGFALIYGATGSLSLVILTNPHDPMLLVAFALVLIGFAFKIGLVPFHFWIPDVYHGAPTSVTGFMSALVKVAAFGAFLRIVVMTQGYDSEIWRIVFYVLSALTMTIGNLLALRQQSTKRMRQKKRGARLKMKCWRLRTSPKMQMAQIPCALIVAQSRLSAASIARSILTSCKNWRQKTA